MGRCLQRGPWAGPTALAVGSGSCSDKQRSAEALLRALGPFQVTAAVRSMKKGVETPVLQGGFAVGPL